MRERAVPPVEAQRSACGATQLFSTKPSGCCNVRSIGLSRGPTVVGGGKDGIHRKLLQGSASTVAGLSAGEVSPEFAQMLAAQQIGPQVLDGHHTASQLRVAADVGSQLWPDCQLT